MKAILFALIFLPLVGWGQVAIQKHETTGRYTCEAVVQVDSMKAGVMFNRALEWIAINYRSAKDVIQYSDQAAGKIICKGNFKVGLYMKEGWVEHTMILEFKDGRYRYTFTDFVYFSAGSDRVSFDGNNMMGKKRAIEVTEEKVSASVSSLNEFLKTTKSSGEW